MIQTQNNPNQSLLLNQQQLNQHQYQQIRGNYIAKSLRITLNQKYWYLVTKGYMQLIMTWIIGYFWVLVMMLTLASAIGSLNMKIIVLLVFSFFGMVLGYILYLKLQARIQQQIMLGQSYEVDRFVYRFYLQITIITTFTLAMSAIDLIMNDYHFFLCGVGSLSIFFIIGLALILSLVSLTRAIYREDKEEIFIAGMTFYFVYFWPLYFWYLLGKFEIEYNWDDHKAMVILTYIIDIPCIGYIYVLFKTVKAQIKIKYYESQVKAKKRTFQNYNLMREQEYIYEKFILILFFASPIFYVQLVGTFRMFTSEINYALFSLIIHFPFILLFIFKISEKNYRYLIFGKRQSPSHRTIREKLLIKDRKTLYTKYKNQFQNKIQHLQQIPCVICKTTSANTCFRCQNTKNIQHIIFCLQCLKTYLKNNKKYEYPCPVCSFRIVGIDFIKPVMARQRGKDYSFIQYFVVLSKNEISEI